MTNKLIRNLDTNYLKSLNKIKMIKRNNLMWNNSAIKFNAIIQGFFLIAYVIYIFMKLVFDEPDHQLLTVTASYYLLHSGLAFIWLVFCVNINIRFWIKLF